MKDEKKPATVPHYITNLCQADLIDSVKQTAETVIGSASSSPTAVGLAYRALEMVNRYASEYSMVKERPLSTELIPDVTLVQCLGDGNTVFVVHAVEPGRAMLRSLVSGGLHGWESCGKLTIVRRNA